MYEEEQQGLRQMKGRSSNKTTNYLSLRDSEPRNFFNGFFGLTVLLATMLIVVPATAQVENEPQITTLSQKLKKVRKAFSLFGVEQFSEFRAVNINFSCRELTDDDNYSPTYSHQCTDTDKKIWIRVAKSQHGDKEPVPVVAAYAGTYQVSLDQFKKEKQYLVDIAGSPDTVEFDKSGEAGIRKNEEKLFISQRLTWGGKNYYYDSGFGYEPDTFRFFARPTKKGTVKITRVFHSGIYPVPVRIDFEESAANIIFDLLPAGFLFVIGYLSFYYHKEHYANIAVTSPRSLGVRGLIYDLLMLLLPCLVLAALAGGGGEICNSSDMFGCTEHSGDYVEAKPGTYIVESFFKFFIVALIGWWISFSKFRHEIMA
jgi:hypothetical protein